MTPRPRRRGLASRRPSSPRAAAARLERFAAEHGSAGLIVFAIDTELLGHWWWEGPDWLAEVLRVAPEHGIELVTLGEARAGHEPRGAAVSSARPGARARTCGPGTRRRSPTSPGRRGGSSCGSCAASAPGSIPRPRERAARELLAVQASDWAFLDHRRQAGDYPFQRSTGHAGALLEAINSASEPPPARMRNLAPDLSLTPLLEP